MSVRLRLTLLYSALLALTLIVFSGVLYMTVSRVTLDILEETLADEAERLVDSRKFRLDHIDYPASKFAAPETYAQTISLDGDVVDRTANLGDYVLPLSDAGLRTCQKGRPWTETTLTENGRLITYSKPVRNEGKVVGVVQVGRSLADYDQSLNTLKRILIIGSSVVTLAAFAFGWVLAGMALRPIHRITQTAQVIGTERDFDRRVDYTGPNDEVGQLATTFNAMLTELQAAYRQVEETLQAQRRFVADASHELRTPLTTIRGNLELLRREPPISAEDRVAVLADMVDEGERLIRLTHDLLVLARADAGRPLQREPVRLKPLIEDVCRQARLLDSADRVRYGDLLDVTVTGDRDALKQVLLTLLDNALRYTPADGQISVSTARVDEGVAISVWDTGPGIEPAVLPHIFERFYQGDVARTEAGFGLGLAIAKTLIEAQDGTITVESEVGKGSVFTVILAAGASRT
ncbi:MAG: sensor histidine kinase [Anaerolineae bacterium]